MKKLMFSMIFLLVAACAHHRDVRPGADGMHRVLVRGEERESAERSALDQAEHYCSEVHKKHAAFTSENTKYTGSMDEETRSTVKKASTAATILGGVGSTSRHGDTRTGGTVLGTAGVIGGVMTSGDDYTAEMSFKCQ